MFDNGFHQVGGAGFVDIEKYLFLFGFDDPGIVNDVVNIFDHVRERIRMADIAIGIFYIESFQQGKVR